MRHTYEGENQVNDHGYLKKELYDRAKKDIKIFDFLKDNVLDGIWYWDLEQPENEYMSDNFWRMLGYDPDKKKHVVSEWKSLVNNDDLKMAEENFDKHLENPDHPYDHIVRYKHKDGSTVWVKAKGIAIRNNEGKPIRMLGAFINITDLAKTNQWINKLKDEYEKVFNGTQDALFLIDVKGDRQFEYIRNNDSHQKKTGISLDTIEGKSPEELLGEDAAKDVIAHYQECVDERNAITYDETLDLPAGKRIWHTTLTPIINDQKVIHIVGSSRDVTEQKELEKELERRANYDMLTSLANREFLSRKVDECTKDASKQFSYIFVDLDDFKKINDRHGHLTGDYVLKKTAERLLSVVDEDDFVARLGGDEFVILKCEDNNHGKIETFVNHALHALSQPLHYEGNCLEVSASIGVSRFPSDGKNYDELTHLADRAMYKMKNKKKNNKG